LIICIGFALEIYLWPSLEKVLEVLIHPPLRRHLFPSEDKAQEEEDEDQDDEPPQEEDIDQGEMKMIKTMKMIKKFGTKDRHTQESTKQFKEITPSTPYLVTFTRE
jgi:hypothetical protein